MSKIFILFSACIFTLSLYTQNISLENASNLKDYPNIKLKVVSENPVAWDASRFQILENDFLLPFQFKNLGSKNDNNQKYQYLFLVENLNQPERLVFYKNVIYQTFASMDFSNSWVNIAVFDRVRNNGTEPIRLLLNHFTNDKELLINTINSITPINDVFGNNLSSDLYHATYEGLNVLSKQYSEHNNLFIFSTAFNNKWSSHTSSESAKVFAKEHHIHIYSTQLYLVGYEHHKLSDLAKATYGEEVVTQSQEEATRFLTQMIAERTRKNGQEYLIEYESKYPKDGKLHQAVLSVDGTKNSFDIQAKKTFFTWINGLIGIGIFTLLIGTIVWLRIRFKKMKTNFSEVNERLSKEKLTQEKLSNQIVIQQEKIDNITQSQKRKEFDEIEVEKEKVQFELMKKFSSLPSLEFIETVEGKQTTKSFQIHKSIISIGRNPQNDLILNDLNVSRFHAQIFFKESKYIIRDMNSTIGTKLNGRLVVNDEELKHNSIISIGKNHLTFII